MPDKSFTFEIQEHLGTISSRDEGWNRELNLIRWNGAAAKYDIREWDKHHERMSKGITLTPWEMRKLVDLIVSRNNDAAVARGRAIEAERNARRLAARERAAKDESSDQSVEGDALEGAVPPFMEEPEVNSEDAVAEVVEHSSRFEDDEVEQLEEEPQNTEF